MDGIAWAASAMAAARTRVTIAAGNIANVSTGAFTRHIARGRLTGGGAVVVSELSSDRGALRRTGRALDFAIVGKGSFHVADSSGRIVETRDGSFQRDAEGVLRDAKDRALQGTCGVVRLSDNGTIDPSGDVFQNGRLQNHLPLPSGSTLQSGFLETSSVDAISEMVDMLAAQRSFESAQKVVTAIDGVREKNANDVARLK